MAEQNDATPVSEAGPNASEVKRIKDWLLERNRDHLAAMQDRTRIMSRKDGDAEMFLDAAILLSSLAALAKPASSPAGGDVREALREIAEQDVTEIALDPDWPRRIARTALSQSTSAGRGE